MKSTMNTIVKPTGLMKHSWIGVSALAMVLALPAAAADGESDNDAPTAQQQQPVHPDKLGVSRNDGPKRDIPAADNWGASRDAQEADMENAADDADQGMASDTTAQPTGPAGQAHQDQQNPAGPQTEAIAQKAFPNVPLGQLQDRPLTNLGGVEVGTVQNVVVNPETGEAALLVSVGGFLGMGNKEVLVGAEEVKASQGEIVWQSNGDEEALKALRPYRQQDYVSVR